MLEIYLPIAQVNIDIFSPDADKMYIADDPACSTGSYEPYVTNKTWTLSATNQTVNVYAKFKDSLGNESTCEAYQVIHDDIRPDVVISSTELSTTDANPIAVDITFSENVTGFTESDIVITNATIEASSFTGSDASYSLNLVPIPNSE